MGDTFGSVAADLRALFDNSTIDSYRHVAGKAAKEAAADAAKGDLGADMAMSNFRRRVPLKSGYEFEAGTSLVLGLRPAGLWNLADRGRRTEGLIKPRRRGGKAALDAGFPDKYGRPLRALSRFGPSRGLGTVDDAEKRIEVDVVKAVDRAVAERVGRF